MAIQNSTYHFGPIWGEVVLYALSMAALERAMVVSYRLSIVTISLSITIRPQFAIECLWRSKQQGGWSLWNKMWGGRVDRSKPNLNKIFEWHGNVVCERNRVDIFSRLSTMHERARQTDRPRNGNIDSNRPNNNNTNVMRPTIMRNLGGAELRATCWHCCTCYTPNSYTV